MWAAEEGKPHVVIPATGGTIAGSAATETQAGYTSGQVGVEVLIIAAPQLADLAEVTGEQVANIGSQDMTDAVRLKLANRINELAKQADVDGIVITHGTDSIEETGYSLNLVVKTDKPVVMTAAMRPSTALSADGPLNIFNAVAVAADPDARARGVLVAAADDFHGARGITKTSTTDVQIFLSPERGLIWVSLDGVNKYIRYPYRTHTSGSEFSVADVEALPRVDAVPITADVSPDLIDCAVANGAKGLVTAGVGNGNMTAAAFVAGRRAIAKRVVVVRSSRVAGGSVGRNEEINNDEVGTVASGELNPARARVLLKLALLKTKDAAKIQDLFDRY